MRRARSRKRSGCTARRSRRARASTAARVSVSAAVSRDAQHQLVPSACQRRRRLRSKPLRRARTYQEPPETDRGFVGADSVAGAGGAPIPARARVPARAPILEMALLLRLWACGRRLSGFCGDRLLGACRALPARRWLSVARERCCVRCAFPVFFAALPAFTVLPGKACAATSESSPVSTTLTATSQRLMR